MNQEDRLRAIIAKIPSTDTDGRGVNEGPGKPDEELGHSTGTRRVRKKYGILLLWALVLVMGCLAAAWLYYLFWIFLPASNAR